jgi:sarcosine oxidase subunit alpha
MTNRFADAPGIDVAEPVHFQFDNRTYVGYLGDTLASALLANNVRLIGRSFKYHRPRGVFSDGSDEPNALVTVLREGHPEPNTRATEIELYDGLKAWSQNAWPSLRFDLLAVNDWLSKFLTAGFYYKTFMWPARFWEAIYEPMIRRAAGIGRLSDTPDPSVYDKGYLHPDVLVIGAGLAGLVCSLQLAKGGQRVLLVDEHARFGGRLLFSANAKLRPWLDALVEEVLKHPNIQRLIRTVVFGSYDHGVYGAITRNTEHQAADPGVLPKQTYWTISAGHTILATGALTRSIAFPNNDRPGIMTMSAIEAYAVYYGALKGSSVALFISHEEGRRTALRLHALGVNIKAVIDTRSEALPLTEFPYFTGSQVVNTSGRLGLTGIQVRSSDGTFQWINVDYLGISGGYNPTIQLTCHQGAKPKWDLSIEAFRAADNRPDDQRCIGGADGAFGLGDCWQSAIHAAEAILGQSLHLVNPFNESEPLALQSEYVIYGHGPTFVDMQNDVTIKDIQLSHQEGMSSVEHVKRYTTLGMATDQGKHSNVLGLAALAQATGQSIAETGTTLSRPPYTGVSIGALAGQYRDLDFKPTRLTPSHQAATARHASFVEVGNWLRAQWFPLPHEKYWRETVDREVIAVRRNVGVCDVTTLGKIDVQGEDAAAFLNHVYANGFLKLPVGKTRYGLMLREDGIVMDDGTAARLSETQFVVTTTTANAVPVYRHMEYVRQCLCPKMDVHLISTTEAWAQFAVAGPRSRELIARLVACDVSNEVFPFMACAETHLRNGIRARLFRISFSGELAFEIAVPTRVGNAFFEYLLEIGKDLEVTPYGTEALSVLRIEKGHAAGAELNGQTTAKQLGLERIVSQTKDSIGRVLAGRDALQNDTACLVGLQPVTSSDPLVAGAHLVGLGKPIDAAHDLGYVTSVAYSPHCQSMIGLAYLKEGASYRGKRIRAVSLLDHQDIEVDVVSPHFVDPDGERLRV